MVVVTTEGLFRTWLREHRKWWNDNNVPLDPAQALRHTSFYTQALNTDAAVFKFAELPVKKPAAASLVFAMVGTRAQDVGSREANEVTLALLQGGKLYVVRVKAGTKLGPFPPCDEIWDKAPQNSPEGLDRADRAFRRCFACARRATRDFPNWCGRRRTLSTSCRRNSRQRRRRASARVVHTTFLERGAGQADVAQHAVIELVEGLHVPAIAHPAANHEERAQGNGEHRAIPSNIICPENPGLQGLVVLRSQKVHNPGL